MRKKLQKAGPKSRADWVMLFLVLALLVIGIVFVFDASVAEAYYQFDDKYHFARQQIVWVVIGLISLLVTARFPLKIVKQFSKPFFIVGIVLLVMVLIPGFGQKVQGARRWLALGPITLQPSELIKLACVLYFPTWLVKKPEIKPFVGLTGLIMFLLMLEPDLGTTIIIAGIAFTMFFISGAKLKHVAGLLVSGMVIGSVLILSSPYRRARLTTFFNPTNDPLGSSYHIRQVLISLGSGRVLGTGFGRSRQKYQFLPEATTDSIFAVIAEETGFVGAMVIISLYLLFIARSFKTISTVDDAYAKLVGVGALAWIVIQALLNLGAMVALIPLTGVPLPYISYGGSSLMTIMTATGLLLNSSRYRKLGTIRSR